MQSFLSGKSGFRQLSRRSLQP